MQSSPQPSPARDFLAAISAVKAAPSLAKIAYLDALLDGMAGWVQAVEKKLDGGSDDKTGNR